ncbi:hypothetical protein HYR99_02560 [Candidatus Poribacteria bacterium]|nr:hypothetical protein [Candidatus Poribacteria bacterium]
MSRIFNEELVVGRFAGGGEFREGEPQVIEPHLTRIVVRDTFEISL